jgi:hypothetical protein
MKHLALAAVVSAIVSPSPVLTATPQYPGVYAAMVVENVDPLQQGRVFIDLPSIPAANVWASASAPYAGGALPAVPPIGSAVWVEFQGGNPSYPVWIGWRP